MRALILILFSISNAVAGPLIVTDAYVNTFGNIITGNFTGTVLIPAITIITIKPVIILNSTVSGPGDLINAYGISRSNLTILNTMGIGTNPNVRMMQKGIFVKVLNPVSLAIRNCNINGVRIGVYMNGYWGDTTHNQTVRIMNNNFVNIDARPSNAIGAYMESGQYNGQAIHIQNAQGPIEIGWNSIINQPGQSSTGALIEFSEVRGTGPQPFMIHDNFISGAFPTAVGKDLFAFGGILMNGASSDTSSNVTSNGEIYNNVITATAGYGIALIAGNSINIHDNRVVSSGYTQAGVFYMQQKYGTPWALLSANLYGQQMNVFFNNVFSDNAVGLMANIGGVPTRNDWYLSAQPYVNDNTHVTSTPTYQDEQTEYNNWIAR